MTRRDFLILLASLVLATASRPALAKDGEGDSDGGGHDDGGDDGGHDDGGDDGGHDDGGDDGGHDDGGEDGGDDGGHEGDDGDRGKKREDVELSQDEALSARQQGRVISLETALRIANAKVRGRIIDVDLAMRAGKPQYRVKIRRSDGVIKTVRLDARTGRVVGFLGF